MEAILAKAENKLVGDIVFTLPELLENMKIDVVRTDDALRSHTADNTTGQPSPDRGLQ